MDKRSITPKMTTAFKDETEFSPRSPSYKRPQQACPQPMPRPSMSNANIDIKLKLLKEQILEEVGVFVSEIIVDGGNLDMEVA